MADLHNYETADYIREATAEETQESIAAAKHDGGVGAISADGIACYVINEDDVCLAGNPAQNSICGERDCVCSPIAP